MTAPANFLFIMDPYETLNLETETSLLLMQELIERDQGVYWLQPEDLALEHNQPMGRAFQVTGTDPLRRAEPAWTNLNRFDAVLVRKDPPFDTGYLQLTLILDHLDPDIAQFNDVKALRDFNEKILPLRWPEFTPPTLISMNADQLAHFTTKHQSVVLKPLNDCSGRGISKIDWDKDGAFRQRLSDAGKPVGIVNRVPQAGSYLANIHQGATCEAAELSARENHIIKTIAPFLREQGVFLAGADFIDDYLTELNITSPSAIRQINAVSGQQVQRRIVDAMLDHMSLNRPDFLKIAAVGGCCR